MNIRLSDTDIDCYSGDETLLDSVDILIECRSQGEAQPIKDQILNNQAVVENINKEITKHEDYLKIKRALWLVSHEVCFKELQLLNKILETTLHSKGISDE